MMAQTLPNIERGDTWTDEHRRACLDRAIQRMTQPERETMYQGWAKHHGKARADALRRAVERDA